MNKNANWYEESNQSNYNFQTGQKAKKEGKNSGMKITAFGLIVCMVITALLGGVTGALVGASISNTSEMQPQTAELSMPVQQNNQAQNLDVVNEKPQTISVAYANVGTHTKAQIIEMCTPSVVGVNCEYATQTFYGDQVSMGSGSGVIYTSDGYIITNNHVVEGATKISVVLSDDTEYPAELIGVDSRTDLALLKIDAQGLTVASLTDSDNSVVGEEVIVIGNPLGEFMGSSTSGIISAVNRNVTIDGKEMTLIQTDAAVNPGNSGGGMFNSSAELVGIVNAKIASASTEGMGFAIPANTVKAVVEDLRTQGYVSGRAYLGVYTQNVSTNNNMADGRNGNYGYFGNIFGFTYPSTQTAVQVVQVIEGSAAEKAGIQAGDLLLAIDENRINTNSELSGAIEEYNAGDVATIVVQRDGQELELQVIFGEYIPD